MLQVISWLIQFMSCETVVLVTTVANNHSLLSLENSYRDTYIAIFSESFSKHFCFSCPYIVILKGLSPIYFQIPEK